MLKKNQQLKITIDPWAVVAEDGSEMVESYVGSWHTPLAPLYAHPEQLRAIGGKLLDSIPDMLLYMLIYDASRFVDATAIASCPNPNLDYFCVVRNRYVVLRALLALFDGFYGPSQVKKKVLGDFEIEFDTKNGPGSLIPRLLDELKKLEPVVLSMGCIGIGAGHGLFGVTKGANDPYRPVAGRSYLAPDRGDSPVTHRWSTPGFEENNPYYADRYRRAGEKYFPGRRRRR